MKKIKINKQKTIIIITILLLGLIPILTIYNSNNIEKLNKTTTNKLYKEPINKNFKDDNLYNCVIDAYNKKNNTSLPYTTNLTDEQLLTITELDCDSANKDEKKISNTQGIEKLTNLTLLTLNQNNFTSINLSKNTKLKELGLVGNYLSSLDLSNNSDLEGLALVGDNLTSINLNNNINLTDLFLGGIMDTLDLSNNTKLVTVFITSANLNTIDLSNNKEITYLSLVGSKLNTIDLSKNIKLETLDLSSNNLTTIDLSNNNNLTTIDISNNNLTLEDTYLKKDESIVLAQNIKLPSKYTISYEIENNEIAKYENGNIIGLESGNSKITATLNGIKENKTSTANDIKVSGNIYVYDYISEEYDLNNDNIYLNQNETLDKNKITCTNCTTEISDNKLIIKVNNTIVKEYTIKYNDPTPTYEKGDINHDGKINLIDLGKIFSHIRGKSIIKDESLLKECDLNNDGKVNLLDVGKLFSFIRGKTKIL